MYQIQTSDGKYGNCALLLYAGLNIRTILNVTRQLTAGSIDIVTTRLSDRGDYSRIR